MTQAQHASSMQPTLNLSTFPSSTLLTPSSCHHWLSLQLNRQAEPADLYQAGKLLYQLGRFDAAEKMLRLYTDGEGAEMPGYHLLGYASSLLDSSHHPHAITCLKRCVNHGFDADWQLLVEMQVEVDRMKGEGKEAGKKEKNVVVKVMKE